VVGGGLYPDLVDPTTNEVYEIKPVLSRELGYIQLAGYLLVLNSTDPSKRIWIPGVSYIPPAIIEIKPGTIALVSPPVGGVVLYYVVDLVEAVALVTAYQSYRMSLQVLQPTIAFGL
jgi:hypothetical protein